MRNLFQQIVQGAVLSMVMASNSHADFLNTITQTMSQVQQAVENTKQAVESTKQAVNGAQQTIDSTKNTVEQGTSQFATQPPAPQPLNGAGLDSQALYARAAAVNAHVEKVMAKLAPQAGGQGLQFQQAIMGISIQSEMEIAEVQQQLAQQLQKDPGNTVLQSQHEAQTNAAQARKYDRLEQYCRDVETGKVQFQARR